MPRRCSELQCEASLRVRFNEAAASNAAEMSAPYRAICREIWASMRPRQVMPRRSMRCSCMARSASGFNEAAASNAAEIMVV